MKKFVIGIIQKIKEQSPVKYKLVYTATCLQPINISKCSVLAQKEMSEMLELFLIVVGYQKKKLKKLKVS